MSYMAILCKWVEISCLGCVKQNVVQNVPSLTRFLPYYEAHRQWSKIHDWTWFRVDLFFLWLLAISPPINFLWSLLHLFHFQIFWMFVRSPLAPPATAAAWLFKSLNPIYAKAGCASKAPLPTKWQAREACLEKLYSGKMRMKLVKLNDKFNYICKYFYRLTTLPFHSPLQFGDHSTRYPQLLWQLLHLFLGKEELLVIKTYLSFCRL